MKVSISGSFSVGKSTLFNELKKHVSGYDFLNETTREVMAEMNKSNQSMTLEERVLHQKICVARQIEKEFKSQNFITDYCVLDNLNYSYGLSIYDEVNDLFEKHLQNIGGYDMIFYVPIEFKLEKDGQRYEDSEFQKEIDVGLKNLIKEFQLPSLEVRGTLEQRVEQILKYLIKKI